MCKSKLIVGNYELCKEPVLSILIPTFRKNEYLFQAIDSAVNQRSNFSYEIIVVSNDPDSSLADVKAKYENIENFYLYQNDKNIGMVRNSNRCVELARGKYIAFLHDDDFLLANYMDVIRKYILQNQAVDCLLTGRYVKYDGRIKVKERIKNMLRVFYFIPDLYRKKVKKIGLIDCLKSGINIYFSPSCGTVILKDAFLTVGGFDETIAFSFDLDFFLRLNSCYDIYETTEICAVYRIGDNASLKNNVKYDFFNYFRNQYFDIMTKNNVDNAYVVKHKKEFLYLIFKQLGSDFKNELISRNERIEPVGSLRLLLYRLKTALYYYNHNLDIQRLRIF